MVLLMIALVIISIIIILALNNVRIVTQSRAVIIERLGKYRKIWHSGIHMKTPFIERMSDHISLKEQVINFPPEQVMTTDKIMLQIDTVAYFKIIDPYAYSYDVENPMVALTNLTAAKLHSIIGELTLDMILSSRELINARLLEHLDEGTNSWGIKINRVELKNVIPPHEIQESAVLLKNYESLLRVTEGSSTKIVLPSDLQSLKSFMSIDKYITD